MNSPSRIREEGVIGIKYIEAQGHRTYLVDRNGYAIVPTRPEDMQYVKWAGQIENKATIMIREPLPSNDDATHRQHEMTMAIPVWQVSVSEKSTVASFSGRRWIPFTALFLGPGKSAIDSTREVLTALRFRATGEREASASSRIMRPQGVALPIMNFSAKVRVIDDRIDTVALRLRPSHRRRSAASRPKRSSSANPPPQNRSTRRWSCC